jgi:hypothetical protein
LFCVIKYCSHEFVVGSSLDSRLFNQFSGIAPKCGRDPVEGFQGDICLPAADDVVPRLPTTRKSCSSGSFFLAQSEGLPTIFHLSGVKHRWPNDRGELISETDGSCQPLDLLATIRFGARLDDRVIAWNLELQRRNLDEGRI